MTHRTLLHTTGARLTLDIWHPNCWTLEVTDEVPAGLLGHGVHEIEGHAQGRFTAYADTRERLEDLLDAIEDSRLTDSMWVMEQPHELDTESSIPGYTTCGLVVRYDIEDSINDPLVSRGFIPDAPVRMYDGREYWTVVVTSNRETVRHRLNEIREEVGAEITVQDVCTPEEYFGEGMFLDDPLSDRQREVFELARDRGYYTWPRTVSAADLAEELDVSETTLLEHLRKAEAKLFGGGETTPGERS